LNANNLGTTVPHGIADGFVPNPKDRSLNRWPERSVVTNGVKVHVYFCPGDRRHSVVAKRRSEIDAVFGSKIEHSVSTNLPKSSVAKAPAGKPIQVLER